MTLGAETGAESKLVRTEVEKWRPFPGTAALTSDVGLGAILGAYGYQLKLWQH